MEMRLIFGQKLANSWPRDSLLYRLIEYANNNFIEDLEDWKSVMGYYFFSNRAIVSWSSKKQRTILILQTEAKYIAFRHAAKEAVLIKKFINKKKLEAVEGITLHGNNEMSIALIKNAKS